MYTIKCERCNAAVINGVACHEQGCTGHLVFTKGLKSYNKWTVWSLDVWGNHKDGYEVNDRSKRGSVLIPVDSSDRAILRILKLANHLNKNSKYASFRTDGDDSIINIDWNKTGEPLLTLEVM